VSGVAELDEVQYDLEVDGETVRRQLARRVWERGGWATIAITFVERDRGGEWKAPQLALLRFKRADGGWQRHAAIAVPVDELAAFLATATAS
jgi:hypothetical protein